MGELFRERPTGDGGRFGPDVLGEPGCGASWIRRRERFYAGALGPMREPAVYHWDDDGDPHVDVYIIGRSRSRPFETLITGGLADRPQPGVPILSDRPRRVEVLLRIGRAEDWAAMILREISTLPFLFGLALEEEGLIQGSRPIRPGSDLRHALLVVAREERGLAGFLV
ncbi:MAG: suppressor of fused domain protein, partial [Planctomycetota bacterium]